jgi:hypothetical protein
MISRRKLPELRTYARAEASLPFRSGPEYGRLVVPNGNENTPVHRWFKYKEAFSADLLDHLILHGNLGLSGKSSIRLLDPFCGVGTSLVSSQLIRSGIASISAVGIECNPFAAFVANAKASWPTIDPERMRTMAAKGLSGPRARLMSLPSLSSIKSGRCIGNYASRQILSIRDRLQSMDPGVERDALLVGLASCIERVSKVRRDGRALRLVEKRKVNLRKLLASRWESMAQDVEYFQLLHPRAPVAKVVLGDGRNNSGLGRGKHLVDMILTSPPYPNNIDYNEVYKLELWLLGFVSSAEEFLDLRRDTYRSHPTCRAMGPDSSWETEFAEVLSIGPLADLLRLVFRRAQSLDRDCSRGRSKVLLGYVYDTWRSLKAHHRSLNPGGCAVYVVGNSLHGGQDKPYLVPTDLLVACLGEQVGFQVEQLIVARPLQRRLAGNHFLRDSLLVLRST